jgi:transcriptional regulator with XRE-family HTH domain
MSEEEPTVDGQPPVRRRLLGTALRKYRENVGYRIEEAARVLDCDRSKISRIETGQRGITAAGLRELLTEYGVPAAEQEALVALAYYGHEDGWWRSYRDVLSEAGADLALLEASATQILGFQAQVVPDLLQTEEYAQALADADPGYSGEQERALAVKAKLVRQAIVLGERRAHLEVVLAEGAVRQMVGGAAVMRRQLRRLANLGTGDGVAVGDVTVQVLPFEAGAHSAAGAGAMTILRFGDVPGLGIVHLGGLRGGASLDSPEDVARYGRAFALLRATALTPEASVQMLRDMARALPRE